MRKRERERGWPSHKVERGWAPLERDPLVMNEWRRLLHYD